MRLAPSRPSAHGSPARLTRAYALTQFKYIYFPPARDVVELKDGQDLDAANRDMARRALARYVSKHRGGGGGGGDDDDSGGKRDSERAE